MKNPPAIVPGSIMPKYTWQFEKNADLATAYDEAVSVMNVFGVPYNQGDNPKVPATFEEAKKMMIEEAKDIVKDMKDPRVKEALANGEIKEIVALIAYLNSLK
jgi:cytochrome c oxidase cbb3-type subunit 2